MLYSDWWEYYSSKDRVLHYSRFFLYNELFSFNYCMLYTTPTSETARIIDINAVSFHLVLIDTIP